LVPAWRDIPNPADKIQKLAGILSASSREGIYHTLVSQWQQPEQLVLGVSSQAHWLGGFQPIDPKRSNAFVEWMMFLDLVTYLPDDILVKVDRASMGVSLEQRSPYLDDHEIVAFALRLPLSMKIRAGQGKWILRQVLDKYLPADLVRRPKMGFAIPIDSWLRGPLRQWAEALLEEGRLAREGFFNPQPIRRKWDEHLAGVHNWQYELWSILMFEAWLDSGGGRR
jgi:asparagine synthase (glutamine-hydrolysing)